MSSNYLGIDYGAKRVGLALASHETHMAQPLQTLDATDRLLEMLQEIIATHNVTRVVVGLPRNLEGDDTPQTAIVRKFAAELEMAGNVPIILQDEALTTEAARENLTLKHSGTIKKELVDAEAAAIILQDYLDSL